jgi:hypothetical protein
MACAGHVRHGQHHLYRKLSEVLQSGKAFISRIVFETDDETEALIFEHDRIEQLGFENLFNVASHAFLGRVLKPEVRQRVSQAIKGMWQRGVYKNRKVSSGFCKPNQRRTRGPQNRRHRPKSGFQGVSCFHFRYRSGKVFKQLRWGARTSVYENGKSRTMSLGYFKSALEAATAYDNAMEQLRGVRPNGTQKII